LQGGIASGARIPSCVGAPARNFRTLR
jgi:hypothetical protein